MAKKKRKKKFETLRWYLKTIGGYFKEDIENIVGSISETKDELKAHTNYIDKAVREMMAPTEYKVYRATDNFFSLWSIFALIVAVHGVITGAKFVSPQMIFSVGSLLSIPIIWSKLYSKKIDKCIKGYKEKHEWDADDDY